MRACLLRDYMESIKNRKDNAMKFISLFALLFVLVAVTGCQSSPGYVGLAQDVVLPRLEPDQRASYRASLGEAVDNYDGKYDLDGHAWPEEEPEPVEPEEPEEPETDDPEESDPADDAEGDSTG